MAKDLKLTARLENRASKEIEKIISDLDRLAKTAASTSARQATQADGNARRAIGSEERVMRERIRIQRASAALSDKQNRESLASEDRSSRAKIALQRQSALLEEKQAKATEDAAKRANDAKMKADERAFQYKIALQRRSAALADRQESSLAAKMKRADAKSLTKENDKADAILRIQRRAALEEAALVENRFDRRIAVERVRHQHRLSDLKGNNAAQEAEMRRHGAVVNRIQMDKANLPNTPFQRLLGQVGAGQKTMGIAASIGGVAAGATAAAAAIYGVSRAVGSVVEAGYRLDTIQRSLNFAAGSAKEGAKDFAFLSSEAKRLGFDVITAATGFSQLSAAAKGTALEGKGAKAIFSSVSEASITLGLSAEQTSGALNAIQQMISKGTVQSEELRGQLGERLPGAFQIAARAMGTTTQGLGKMLENGQVLADDFLPKFAAELHKTFGDSAEDASNRGQAAINKLNNRFALLTATIGQDLVKAFGVAANATNIYLDALGALSNVSVDAQLQAQAQIFGFNGVAKASSNAADKLDAQRKAALAVAKAQDEMNAKMASSTKTERESSSKAAYDAEADARAEASKKAEDDAKEEADAQFEANAERNAAIREQKYNHLLSEREMDKRMAKQEEDDDEKEKKRTKDTEDFKLSAKKQFYGGFSDLMQVMAKKNKALARVAQGISIAEAIANTSVAFTKALASGPPPFNYVAAAGVAASGAAQVATISSQRFARGTDYAPGGMALVGEQGPEMVYLSKGSKVKTAQETKASMGGVTHSGPVIFNITMPSGSTTSQAREMGSAMAGGYLDRIKNHRRMDEEAEYYLGSRR